MDRNHPSRGLLIILMVVAILGMSTAAPLIRLAVAPAMVIAFWRMAFGTGLVWSLGWRFKDRDVDSNGTSTHQRRILLALSGLLLGLHFATWVSSLFYTTVAASVVLVDTYPIFLSIYAPIFLGERVTRRQGVAISVALLGAVIIFLDSGEGGGSMKGNLLALAGAATGAGYLALGRKLRPVMGLWEYLTPVYGLSALLLLLYCLVQGLPMFSHPPADWVVFAALAVGPTLLGHTLVNWALRYLPAQVGGLVPLGEPIGAALLAALLPMIGEIPGPLTILGGVIILGGIGLAISRSPLKK